MFYHLETVNLHKSIHLTLTLQPADVLNWYVQRNRQKTLLQQHSQFFLWHTVPAGSGTLQMQAVLSSSAGICYVCCPPNHLLLLILHFLQVLMFFKRLCYFILSASSFQANLCLAPVLLYKGFAKLIQRLFLLVLSCKHGCLAGFPEVPVN